MRAPGQIKLVIGKGQAGDVTDLELDVRGKGRCVGVTPGYLQIRRRNVDAHDLPTAADSLSEPHRIHSIAAGHIQHSCAQLQRQIINQRLERPGTRPMKRRQHRGIGRQRIGIQAGAHLVSKRRLFLGNHLHVLSACGVARLILRLIGVDHTKFIAVGIGQHHKIRIGRIFPRYAGGA